MKTKKETVLSVVKEIRDLLKLSVKPEGIVMETVTSNEIIVNIPKGLTMKDIVEKCDNKTSKGTPLLYYISWYKDENFYTKEKTRGGKHAFSKTLLEESRNKTWHEQEALLKKNNSIRFNAAELLYILWSHEKETGEMLLSGWNYYWTSSSASDGRFVRVGYFDSSGVDVSRHTPDRSSSDLGVCVSRSLES